MLKLLFWMADKNNKALVPVQGNQVGIQNGVVDPNNLPLLEEQENEGIFERTRDDGKTQERMHQKQKKELRGIDTQNQSIRVMEGMDEKHVVQENEEGRKRAIIQEKAKKVTERTATSETQMDLSHKRTVAAVDKKDGTKAAEITEEKSKVLQQRTEHSMLVHAAAEKDRMAIQQRQGQQDSIREQDELELHAQISFDGTKQYSGKFRNVQLMSNETAEGTRIQLKETKAFLGMDDQGELALTDEETFTMEFTLSNYLHNPSSFINQSDVKKGFAGFLDILYRQKKLPWSLGLKILYKFGLFVFYLTSFIYPIIAFSIEQKHVPYNVVCILISGAGLCFELYDIIPDIYRYIKQWNEKRRKSREEEDQKAVVEADNDATEYNPNKEQAKNDNSGEEEKEIKDINYAQKTKYVFKEFVLESLGEMLIYPSIICSLYGFVNEKGWEFKNAIAVFDFIFLLYSIAMDVIYAKVYYIWLLQKVIRISYKAHDEFEKVKLEKLNWKMRLDRYLTPFHLTIPFAITVALSHWMMLAIIGVRIYADNFVLSKDKSTNSFPKSEPATGNYTSAPYTRYMIFCGMYLPIASMIVYVILNKYWFLQIYWLIKNQGKSSVVTDKQAQSFYKYQSIKFIPQSVKMMAFLRDPLAYIAVIFLMAPFIPFLVGTFLPDYNDSDLKITDGARSAALGLGIVYFLLFLASNAQAAIIFAILVVIITITALYILWGITHPKQMAKQAYRGYRQNKR